MMRPARIAIAGGSLGGLTTGLCLRDLGLDVTIFERSPAELQQRGAGIGFLPASYRYLVERAGVALDEISVVTHRIRYLSRRGEAVHDEPHTYRFTAWNTVYRQLLGCFGPERYVLGHEVVGFSQDDTAVIVHHANGETERVDLLVCADGVGSRFRAELLPNVERMYSGYVAWRGMVPESSLDAAMVKVLGDSITYFVYANSHILVYPIPAADGSVEPGQRLVNFVWYRNYLPGGDLDGLLTDASGARHEISVPPGAVRSDHVAEIRATACARLPAVLSSFGEPYMTMVYGYP